MKMIVPLIFLLFLIPGIVHGYVAGTVKDHRDIIKGMSKSMVPWAITWSWRFLPHVHRRVQQIKCRCADRHQRGQFPQEAGT